MAISTHPKGEPCMRAFSHQLMVRQNSNSFSPFAHRLPLHVVIGMYYMFDARPSRRTGSMNPPQQSSSVGGFIMVQLFNSLISLRSPYVITVTALPVPEVPGIWKCSEYSQPRCRTEWRQLQTCSFREYPLIMPASVG